MSVSVVKIALIGLVVTAAVGTPVAIWHRQQVGLRQQTGIFAVQAERWLELSNENQRLSNLVSQTRPLTLSSDQITELLRLRGEIGQLRATVSELDRLRATNQQLLAARNRSDGQPPSSPSPPPQVFQAHWPKNQLAFRGYADPASALQTALWAMNRRDSDTLAASVTPEARLQLTREKWNTHGTSAEEIAASTGRIADSLAPSTGFYIAAQNFLSPDEATLDVYFEGEGKSRKVALKKVGPDWKFDNLGNGAWP